MRIPVVGDGDGPEDLDTSRLANATVYLVQTYIAKRINTLVIRQGCVGCAEGLRHRQRQVIDHVLRHSSPNLSVLLYRGTPDETPWEYTLFVVNDERAFRQQRFTFPDTLTDREFFFLVVVTSLQHAEAVKHAAAEIILAALRILVINVAVLVQLADAQVVTYGYTLFKANCTAGITVQEIGRFDPTTAQPLTAMPDMYPVRKLHLHGCPLKVGANHLPPHFMYRRRSPQPTYGKGEVSGEDLKGMDWELLQLLANALHFRIRLYMPTETTLFRDGGNVSGCLEQLAAHKVDIAIGGLSGSDKRRWLFSASTVYHQSYFVLVVREDRFQARFGHLALPFRGKVWTVIICMLLVAVLATWCLSARVRLNHALENLLLMSLGNPVPVPRVPGSSFLRYLFASWLLLTLVLRCAYQAKLFDVLRLPNQRPLPEDLLSLIEQNFTMISHSNHDFYPAHMTRLLQQSFSYRFKYIQSARPGERLVTISLLNNLAYWNQKHLNSSQLTFIREPLYLDQLVVYFRKRSFLKYAFDRKIKQLLSSGVVSHIERRYLRLCYADMAAKDRDRNRNLLPRITNNIMVGAYRIYCLLLFLALVIFGLERLAQRWRALRRWFDWFHQP
ncbi:uncharacterized protein LOC108165266 [Drosophila miranda]|uniref:uncharacterized protein LOC108165266 n=1 Tax=Drosophila miranda TaxID=7229 RepID=UPI0007E62F4E|nr:uncharacterized protein LOC108165266 [Drosophila miranda]